MSGTIPTWVPTPERTLVVQVNDYSVYMPAKFPSDSLDYTIDWTQWVAATGIQIDGGLVQAETASGILIPYQYFSGNIHSAIVQAGTPGVWRLSFQTFLSASRSICIEVLLPITDQYVPLVIDPIMDDDGGTLVDENGNPIL